MQLSLDLNHVDLRGQPDDDVQLLELDVERVVVLDEEHLDVVLEDVEPLLDDEVDVPQGHVLHLGLLGEQGDQGRGQFPHQVVYEITILGRGN